MLQVSRTRAPVNCRIIQIININLPSSSGKCWVSCPHQFTPVPSFSCDYINFAVDKEQAEPTDSMYEIILEKLIVTHLVLYEGSLLCLLDPSLSQITPVTAWRPISQVTLHYFPIYANISHVVSSPEVLDYKFVCICHIPVHAIGLAHQ